GGGTYCYGLINQSSDQAGYNAREADSNRPELVLLVQQGSSSGNTPPVANADSYSVNEDNVLTVAAPGVLGNDTDADGDPLTVAANGSFAYTPTSGFTGTDSFAYKASDGTAQSGSATVTLNVGGGSGGGGPVVFQEIRSGGSTGSASVATTSALTAVSGHLY